MLTPTLALLLAGCGAAPSLTLPADQLPPPYTMTGSEAVRLSVRDAVAGSRFDWTAPWFIEVTLPAGVTVPGRGLPAGLGAAVGEPTTDPATDGSILQLELPASAYGRTDEEQQNGSAGSFDPPRLCELGQPCLWQANDDGRWRAWRIRTVGGSDVVEEVQLDHAWPDEAPNRPEAAWRVLTVWLPSTSTLLPGDRVVFAYVGGVPRRSTDWLDAPADELRPRVRLRPASPPGAPACLGADRACWLEVPASQTQGLVIHPEPARFAQLVAPLDHDAGAPMTARVVFLDRFSNPSRWTGTLRLLTSGVDVMPVLPVADAWSVPFTVAGPPAGVYTLSPLTAPALDGLPQSVNVLPAGASAWRRKIGDLHIHSGQDGGPSFALSSVDGDHRGNFTRANDAMRYLREVAGHDFGAVSEHSWRDRSWSPPSGTSPWSPGGPCEITTDYLTDDYDWWTLSQQLAWQFQQDNPDFVVFPAFEWHGNFTQGGLDADLHRVVVYREHDAPGFDLPMLPGAMGNRGPQCLYRYLDDYGVDPSAALVIPHMMFPRMSNEDWDLTYRPAAPFDTLISPSLTLSYQSVVEIYSARNAGPITPTSSAALTMFEGNPDEAGAYAPYALRYGWRDVQAVIGVIGASDNHVQTPGSDNLWPSTGAVPGHHHEPGGAAFVLVDPAADPRDGLFDAIRARRTYATSGPRMWADFTATTPGATWPMGSDIGSLSAGALTLSVGLATPRPIRAATVIAVQVGGPDAYQTVASWPGVNTQQLFDDVTIPNPVPPGGAPETWMYYLRAFTGNAVRPRATELQRQLGNQDAVWTSPIWVTWTR
jgi:hypothetical protein